MPCEPSQADRAFAEAFEACRVPTDAFTHRAHLRLAYVYNCDLSAEGAVAAIRTSLKRYLKANGVPDAKYHETLTTAWSRAVRYIMSEVANAESFDAFIEADDRLLDTAIMLTHYRHDTLFGYAARAAYVAPDLSAIP